MKQVCDDRDGDNVDEDHVSGLSGAGSRPGQEAGPRGEDHGGGDRDQEAGDGPLQVQVHHAQQRSQGQLLGNWDHFDILNIERAISSNREL